MRHIKSYNQLFESQQELTQEQMDWLDDCVSGRWQINSQTGLVDIEGDFNYESNVPNFNGVRFGDAGGDFKCSRSSLTSLEGAPQSVSGNFYCSHNLLTSLKGAPQSVGGNFSCSNNSITSLEGGPQSVGYIYQCDHNSLTSLEGAPQKIGWSFDCSHNQLTSLEGAPLSIGGDFDCSHNSIASLEGAPQEVGRTTYCYTNPIGHKVFKGVIYKMTQQQIPLEQAVAKEWRYTPEEDRIYLAKHNPKLSPEERKEYEALARYKERVI
jgi:hypothetical protein